MISVGYFRAILVHKASWSRLQSYKMSTDVLVDTINNVGIITLNREKALNVMTVPMMSQVLSILKQWEKQKSAVIFKGTKNFSAGADLKSLWGNEELTHMMIKNLYHILNKLTMYEIPSISIMDGTTVGSGLSICAFSRYRVATENTVAAMPEAKLGMIPGSYVYSKLKYNLGYYLGMTGSTLKGKEVLRAGLATHYIPKSKLKDLDISLVVCNTEEEVRKVLDEFGERDDVLPLAQDIKNVEYCFKGENVQEILKRLQEIGSDWSNKATAELKAACPGSVAVALKSLQLAHGLDAPQCLKKDFHILHWSMRSHDFREGVRGALFEKGYKPQWNPPTLADVTEEYVDSFFVSLPEDFLHLSPEAKL